MYRNEEAARRVRDDFAAASRGGGISAADLERIVLASLDDVVLPDDFDLAAELAKDLQYLHPKRKEPRS